MEVVKPLALMQTKILIPAYTQEKKGLTFEVSMDAIPSLTLQINTQGNIAFSLKSMLERTVTIMASLNESWKRLGNLNYTLTSIDDPSYCVKDARSASLPLSIALINILRQSKGLNEVKNLTGTGILRVDGTFEESYLEKEKEEATSKMRRGQFIQAASCPHMFELACLMKC